MPPATARTRSARAGILAAAGRDALRPSRTGSTPAPQLGIDRALRPHVLAPRPWRRHLQHEIRTLAFLPDLAVPPRPVLHPEHPEHIRCDRHPWIALLVVDEQVCGDVHVGTVVVVHPQRAEGVENCAGLGVVLRQRLAVRCRVVNRGGGQDGPGAHRRTSRTGEPVSEGCGSRTTVPRRCSRPKRRREGTECAGEAGGDMELRSVARRQSSRRAADTDGRRAPSYPSEAASPAVASRSKFDNRPRLSTLTTPVWR